MKSKQAVGGTQNGIIQTLTNKPTVLQTNNIPTLTGWERKDLT